MIKNALLFVCLMVMIILTLKSKEDFKLIKSIESEVINYKDLIQKQDYVVQKLGFNNYISSTNLGIKTFDEDIFFGEDGNPLDIDRLKSANNENLFFRYSSIGCNTCIEQSLSLLKDFQLDAIIIANYDNRTYLSTFKRMNQLEQTIFRPKENLFLFDTLAYPYFFVLNNNNQITDFHMPSLDDMSHTEEFLYRYVQKIQAYD